MTRFIRFALLAASFAVAPLSAIAQPGPGPAPGPPLAPPAVTAAMTDNEIATGLRAWLADLADFSGVVLVAREGRDVFSAAHGLANRATNAANTTSTAFNFGSIGKAITHTAIAQLVEAGKLKLTDTVGQWLPNHAQAVTRAATVEQLLNHRGGVADFFGPGFRETPKADLNSNAAFYRFVSAKPALFAPGEREQYCNGCYVVLGEIIARVSGTTYEAYIRENVFAKAGMAGASFTPPTGAATPYGKPRPDAQLSDVTDAHGVSGSAAGGSFVTLADLLAFDTALRSGKLAGAGAARVLRVLPGSDWSRARVGFAGGAPGVNALLFGAQGWTIVVMTNLDAPAAERIGRAISDALVGPAPPRN